MKTIKRELILCLSATAFVIVCALAWGKPFVGTVAGASSAHPHLQSRMAEIFHGQVVDAGNQWVLRDSSGQVFQLDNPQQVQSFTGKTITLTGNLDPATRVLHVDQIDSPLI